MPSLAEVFSAHWPAYAQRHRARMPRVHARAARSILQCRTPAQGMVRRVCAGCAKVHIAPLSCGHRACPQCGQAQARQWEWRLLARGRHRSREAGPEGLRSRRRRRSQPRRVSRLLPVPHFLVTLTVPEELRECLRACPRHGYGAMFRAGAEAMKTCGEKILGGTPGWTAVLHTWTRQLGIHPHLHFIVAGCALNTHGALRHLRDPRYLFPQKLLRARWRDALKAALAEAAKTDQRLADRLAKAPPDTWSRPWNVDLQPVGRGETALRYLANYVQKTALDHARIVACDPDRVTIAWRERARRPGETRGLARKTPLEPDEFLRRFLQHVLPSRFQRIRHGGFYSYAAGEAYSRIAALLGHTPTAPEEPWQAKCEDCGGVLQVEAFASTLRCCPSGNATRWRSHSVRLRWPDHHHSRRRATAAPRNPGCAGLARCGDHARARPVVMTFLPLCLTILRWLILAQTFHRARATPNPRRNSRNPPAKPSPLTEITGMLLHLPSKTPIASPNRTYLPRETAGNAKAISYSPAGRTLR